MLGCRRQNRSACPVLPLLFWGAGEARANDEVVEPAEIHVTLVSKNSVIVSRHFLNVPFDTNALFFGRKLKLIVDFIVYFWSVEILLTLKTWI